MKTKSIIWRLLNAIALPVVIFVIWFADRETLIEEEEGD